MSKPLDLPFDPIARAAQTWSDRFGPSGAMAAVTSIMRVQQILLAQLDAVLRPHELTFARYEALVLLTFSSRGTLPMRVIGERLMVHPTSVTNTIGRLEKQGMVVRRPNPRDGRGTLAEITAGGRAVVEHATRDLMAAEFGLGQYDGDQLKEMFDLLRDLRLAAGDFSDGEPAAAVGEPADAGGGPASARQGDAPAAVSRPRPANASRSAPRYS